MTAEAIDVQELKLFYQPPGMLRLTIGEDRSYPQVKLYQAWPLSHPKQYLSLQTTKGDEIVMVDRLDDLPPEARLVAEEEIRRRYLTARVEGVEQIRTEFGVTYWTVRTDKGPRDFVVQSLSESCIWLSERHVLIMDVDGNRFEIPDLTAMDADSRRHLELVF